MAQNKPKLAMKGSKKCHVCDLDSIGTNKFKQHMEDHTEDLNKYMFSNNLGIGTIKNSSSFVY